MKVKRPLKNTYRGSGFQDFLKERGILGEVETRAKIQAASLPFEHLLKGKKLTKTQMVTA